MVNAVLLTSQSSRLGIRVLDTESSQWFLVSVPMQVPTGLRLAPVASVDFSVDLLHACPVAVPTMLGHRASDLELSLPRGPGIFWLGPLTRAGLACAMACHAGYRLHGMHDMPCWQLPLAVQT